MIRFSYQILLFITELLRNTLEREKNEITFIDEC